MKSKLTKEKGIASNLKRQTLNALIALGVIVLIWLVAHAAVGNELLLPDFFACLKRAGALLKSSDFWIAFSATLCRVLLAFLLSFVLAAVFALSAYLLPWLYQFLAPFISLLRSLPTLAVLLIILVWSGAARAPIAVAVLSLFPMLYTGMTAALFEVDGSLIQMSKAYNVPLKKQITGLYLPSIAPYVTRESGAALAFSLKLVVSAEVLANTYQSLGGLMQEAKLYVEMPTLFALVGVTFFSGLLIELVGMLVAQELERRLK